MNESGKVKIIIVDDSPVVLAILKKIFSASPDLLIAGTGRNGLEGLELLKMHNPDVICTDLHMPEMDGLEFIRRVMETNPKPMLVISTAVSDAGDKNVFQLLEAGALDVFPKPSGGREEDYERISAHLVSKVKLLKSVPVFKKIRKTPLTSSPSSHSTTFMPALSEKEFKFVAVGASTGGPNALQSVFSGLPKDFRAPILCVQHISPGFQDSLISWLSSTCRLRITVMEENSLPEAGVIYFPPEGKHMTVNSQGRLVSSTEPGYNGHCPSVNVLFKSLGKYFASKTLAVLLTGMGDDGAMGLLTIRQFGGTTIAEAESSCVVYGMPRVANEIGAAEMVLPLGRIAPQLSAFLK